MVGPRIDRLDQDPEQPEQDGHLYDQRADAPHRAHPRFAVEPHRLLRNPLPVAAKAVLDFSHAGLQVHHGPHLPQLLDG